METIVRISKDNYSNLSYDYFIEDINYLANELFIYCEVKNNKYNNIIEDQKRYQTFKGDFKDKLIVEVKGYSQSEWQTYILHYNKEDIDTIQKKAYFQDLQMQLKRSFTHFNDYICEKFERTTINGKEFNSETYDYTSIIVDYVEFPSKEDIKQAYIANYGQDYDLLIIEE